MDRLFLHAIHLNKWSEFPRPPLTLSEAASRDANYFGRPGDAVTDWDSKGDDSAAAWASLSEAIGRMAIAAQTGEGLPEGMTPKRASALAEAYSMSALNTSMILELGSTREERAAALDQMSDDQLAAVLIGQGTTTDQVLDMVEGNKSIRQGIAHLRKTLKETLSNIDKPNPNPQNQVNNNGAKDDVGGATNGPVGGTNIIDVDPSVANNAHGKPPYNLSKPIQDFEADGTTSYVRVYVDGGNQQGGRWMMKSSDIEGLTPQQIQDKFDLPTTPTHVTDVTPPQGTKIRTGTVNSGNFGGSGGGTQFELQGRIPNVSFTNPRPLK